MSPSKFISSLPPVMPRKRTFIDGSLCVTDQSLHLVLDPSENKSGSHRCSAGRFLVHGAHESYLAKVFIRKYSRCPPSIGFSHHLHQPQARLSPNSSQRPKSSLGPSIPFGTRVEDYVFRFPDSYCPSPKS